MTQSVGGWGGEAENTFVSLSFYNFQISGGGGGGGASVSLLLRGACLFQTDGA